MNNTQLKDLYLLYGFELQKETLDYLVFSYSSGYFYNAEIVFLRNVIEAEVEKCKNEYERLGYSVSAVFTEGVSIDEIHKKLFCGFFNIKASKARIKASYDNYCEAQSRKLICTKYQYLQCDYVSSGVLKSDSVIDLIYEKLTSNQQQLVILEAAAGYGKTCSSFEVYNRFLNNDSFIPIMTELSHNRKAQIFKYVLLDEIDRNFSTKLPVKLVKTEIERGEVPLIIDGFDELLSKSINENSSEDASFEEAQNMLDTIASLLKENSKAKILLTSRKSAIFSGERFDEWVDYHDLGACITRIELGAPNVKTWLGQERIDVLTQKGIINDFLSNPILLSMLREQKIEELEIKSIDSIIIDYFNAILNREVARQTLRLSADEQFDILSRLSAVFAEVNTSSEEPEMILLMLSEVIGNDIKKYISRYRDVFSTDDEVIPDEEEFLMKLVHNALLDRKVSKKNEIGFINDFVFGYLLGNALINGYMKIDAIDYRFVDLICTAYQADDMQLKADIEGYGLDTMTSFSVNQQMDISNKLYHRVVANYYDQTITDITFSPGFDFTSGFGFRGCIFQNCVFHRCVFSDNSFNNCSFFNCVFFNPNLDAVSGSDKHLVFLGCSGHEDLAAKYSKKIEIQNQEGTDYEKVVLEQFWPKGSKYPNRHRGFSTIRKGMAQKDITNMDEALNNLIQKEIVIKLNVCYELNFDKMIEIKTILERDE